MPDTEEAVAEATVNIAALMAKQGYNSDDRPDESTVENKPDNEQKVETGVESQAAKVGAETKVETVVQETKPPVEVVETKPVVEEKQQTVTPTWQEVLKQQQPDTVLKELLGVDDKQVGFLRVLKDLPPQMVGLIETWKANGDLSTHLKEMTTDYSKMSSEDVMRSQLRLDYPKASEKAIDALFKKEVIDAYQLNPDKYSEEEVEEGRLLLDAKADKYRDTLTERQKQFLIPKAPEAAAVIEPDNSEQEKANENFEVYKSQVSNDPYTKNVFTNKQISIGQGEEVFNYKVEPTEITDILFDNARWVEAINNVSLDANGKKVYTPDIEKQMLLGAVAKYGMPFFEAYGQHFKTIGAKKVIEPIENASQNKQVETASLAVPPTSPAAAMAKMGRMTT